MSIIERDALVINSKDNIRAVADEGYLDESPAHIDGNFDIPIDRVDKLDWDGLPESNIEKPILDRNNRVKPNPKRRPDGLDIVDAEEDIMVIIITYACRRGEFPSILDYLRHLSRQREYNQSNENSIRISNIMLAL